MSTVRYSVDPDGIATVIFNREEKRNAITQEMAAGILQAIERAEHDSARVVIIRANPGASVWCAGHDLNELDPQDLPGRNPTLEIVSKVASSPLPVIAMVEGSVHAGGLLILLSADIVVAANSASVSITSTKLGLPLEVELYAYWLRVMGLHKTKELLFTAAAITAEDARLAGLYNHVVEVEQLESKTMEIAQSILSCSSEGVANAKHALNVIASALSLTESDRADIDARNAEMINSPQTRKRIESLLASLRK